MSLVERFYPESQFGGFSDVDGTVLFYSRVNALIKPEMVVLDVGCGRGSGLINDRIKFRRELRYLRGKCEKVIGIDVDPHAEQNPGIDEFHLISSNHWPVADESINLIVSDFVLEHVDDPRRYFLEAARVLKPNGVICARTSNRIGYVALLAKIIQKKRHANILQTVQKDRDERDIFPAHYRVNTLWKIRRELSAVSLHGLVYGYEAEPSYLQFSSTLYFLGKHLHALTPSFLRTCLFVFARKP